MSEFQLKNGMKLYYEDHGIGCEPVILMHGWSSSHDIFEEPAAVISRRTRCIVYDHRGHGGSKDANWESVSLETLASDLNELICGLGLSNITLFGWSMGAATALTYVQNYGCDALKQLVLCDMSPKMLNDETWKLGLYQGGFTADDLSRSAEMSLPEVFKEFVVQAMPKLAKLPDIVLNWILRKFLAHCDEVVLSELSDSMKQADLRNAVEKITVPLTYFYAEPGSLFSPALARWYRTHTNCLYHSVGFTQSSHMLIAEHPELFAQELQKLI